MPDKGAACLVVSGNKHVAQGFYEKVLWLRDNVGHDRLVQVSECELVYRYGDVTFPIFLACGSDHCARLSPSLAGRFDHVLINGACGSLSEEIPVGSTFLPVCTVTTKNEETQFSLRLRQIAAEICRHQGMNATSGTIYEVERIIDSLDNDELPSQYKSESCIDQETATLAEACGRTISTVCGILYVSDNLALGQSLEVVSADSKLRLLKEEAKRFSLGVSVETVIACATA